MATQEIAKGLNYTKQFYEEIADSAKELLGEMQNENAQTVVDQYGIYYNAIAGLIRSGVLCSRVTGTDGFPEIRAVIGSKTYQCREDVLRTILGEEADYIISPYEDTFQSYVPLKFNIPASSDDTVDDSKSGKADNGNVRKLKQEHKAEIGKIKKEYEDQLKTLKQQLKDAKSRDNTVIQHESHVETVTVTDPDLEKKIAELEKNNQKLTEENQKLTDSKAAYESKVAQIKTQLQAKTAELEEKDKYHYDPNYDHYYNEELPQIINSLEFAHTDLVWKVIMSVMCLAGMGVSALFFL